MRFHEFQGPNRERYYYRFEDLGVLVDIVSVTPKDRRGLKEIIEACLSELEEDEHGETPSEGDC